MHSQMSREVNISEPLPAMRIQGDGDDFPLNTDPFYTLDVADPGALDSAAEESGGKAGAPDAANEEEKLWSSAAAEVTGEDATGEDAPGETLQATVQDDGEEPTAAAITVPAHHVTAHHVTAAAGEADELAVSAVVEVEHEASI